MSHTRQSGDSPSSGPLTLERLGEILEAYGAAPERWPRAEREAARRLLEQSAAARALREEAAELDRLLDAVPAEPPSRALAAQVLATAPRRGSRRVLMAVVPLAAAAAITLWLAIEREPARRVAGTTAVWVGEYTSPTDVLLEPYGADVYATVPSVGCSDSVLGCPKVDAAEEPYSRRQLLRRSLA